MHNHEPYTEPNSPRASKSSSKKQHKENEQTHSFSNSDIIGIIQKMVTKDDLQIIKNELRNEVKEVKNEVKEVRNELKDDMKELRNDMKFMFSNLKTTMYWAFGVGGTVVVSAIGIILTILRYIPIK